MRPKRHRRARRRRQPKSKPTKQPKSRPQKLPRRWRRSASFAHNSSPQLNAVLQTVDTPRGLVVTMADVLFASGKYELSQPASLALAKMSGVILAHPGLTLKIAGYTDSTGRDQFNLKLSGQRADAVRTFLVQQGLNPATVTSMGMGSADPVASNDTSVGRQQNRRVEIVVSGEAIGTAAAGTRRIRSGSRQSIGTPTIDVR